MATLAEKWLEKGEIRGITKGKIEGKIEGLLEGIETGLNVKFGKRGLKLLSEIQKIQDADILKAVHKGLWTADSLKELRKIYKADK